MNLTTEFYRDEVRYGFYVPTAIKQAWGAELQVLAEIDRICKKYNIRYFAEWGTLIGAVRHGGFVPWDDDMDIGMLREDYERFKEVAGTELPAEFAIHDYATKENHWLFLARVVNCNQICFKEGHLQRYHNFPYIATVDIFVMDYLYRDEEQEQARCGEVKRILAVADQIIAGTMQDAAREMFLQEFEHAYGVKLTRTSDVRKLGIELYRLAEQQMARVPREESDAVAQIFPWVLKGNRGLPKSCYDRLVRLPFEETTMPVPADYDTALNYRYGDYMTIRKVWGGHDYPYFEGQRKNLEAVAEFALPEFTFRPEQLYDATGRPCKNDVICQSDTQSEEAEGQTLVDIAKQYLRVLDNMMEESNRQIQSQAYESVLEALPELQQLAVDLGTLIEDVRGEENPHVQQVVAKIQEYCDALYVLYEWLQAPEAGQTGDVSDTVTCAPYEAFARKFIGMKAEIQRNCIDRKTVLFVCTGNRQWNAYEPLYNQSRKASDTDVYVVYVPTVFKDIYGRAEFEPGAWQDVNPALLAPDAIYIQDPYDDENPCLTIPPMYYAKNLRKYTKHLVYVPAFRGKEFGPEDTTDLYNMKHYVTAPALLYADRIYVQSENMRQRYLEKLTEFSGDAYSDVWKQKLVVPEISVWDLRRNTIVVEDRKNSEMSAESGSRKTILYCIGENELANLGENEFPHVGSRLRVFAENHENLQLKICFYPARLENWDVDIQQTNVLSGLIDGFIQQNHVWCESTWQEADEDFAVYKDRLAQECDAYYGAPSPYVHAFTLLEKPVMLASTEIEY